MQEKTLFAQVSPYIWEYTGLTSRLKELYSLIFTLTAKVILESEESLKKAQVCLDAFLSSDFNFRCVLTRAFVQTCILLPEVGMLWPEQGDSQPLLACPCNTVTPTRGQMPGCCAGVPTESMTVSVSHEMGLRVVVLACGCPLSNGTVISPFPTLATLRQRKKIGPVSTLWFSCLLLEREGKGKERRRRGRRDRQRVLSWAEIPLKPHKITSSLLSPIMTPWGFWEVENPWFYFLRNALPFIADITW